MAQGILKEVNRHDMLQSVGQMSSSKNSSLKMISSKPSWNKKKLKGGKSLKSSGPLIKSNMHRGMDTIDSYIDPDDDSILVQELETAPFTNQRGDIIKSIVSTEIDRDTGNEISRDETTIMLANFDKKTGKLYARTSRDLELTVKMCPKCNKKQLYIVDTEDEYEGNNRENNLIRYSRI